VERKGLLKLAPFPPHPLPHHFPPHCHHLNWNTMTRPFSLFWKESDGVRSLEKSNTDYIADAVAVVMRSMMYCASRREVRARWGKNNFEATSNPFHLSLVLSAIQ
jgi:hypothetical protein